MAALGIYAWRVEPHWLQLVRRTMPVPHLPEGLIDATLAQISDLHVGPQVDDRYLVGVLEAVRELAPEFVVYTGDFVSHNVDVHQHVHQHVPRVFPRLACGTLGTYGILGNHDYGPGWHDAKAAGLVASLAEDAGIRILRNDLASVRGLTVVGLDELWAGRFEPGAVLPQLSADAASIVLVHNPDAVDSAGWDGYSGWILAGHTHGGQCKPPFLPPPLLPVRNRRYTSGEFGLPGGRRMYISRGVGHLLRVRFNARPEVTMFKLVPGSEHAQRSHGPAPPVG